MDGRVVLRTPPPTDRVFIIGHGWATAEESGSQYSVPELTHRLASLTDGKVGECLLEIGESQVPLHTVRLNLEEDVDASVQRELCSIPKATGIGFGADVRPDGRKFRYWIHFSSPEFETSAIQKRLLSNHSCFPRTIATTDAGVKKSTDSTIHTGGKGLQAGDQVIPLEEATADGMVRVGADLDLEYGTLGCFVWGQDEIESDQHAGCGV